MNPRNRYTPGQPLDTELYAIGRPVTFFAPGHVIEAGTIHRTNTDGSFDVRVTSGGTYKGARLGTLMNPQPNTFVYAP